MKVHLHTGMDLYIYNCRCAFMHALVCVCVSVGRMTQHIATKVSAQALLFWQFAVASSLCFAYGW